MTEASELRAGGGRLNEMGAEADHARRRYDLYKARTDGPSPTSPAQLSQLHRDFERANTALDQARADA